MSSDRRSHIFATTISILQASGYDLLTMDAVASEGRVSKATLYRYWSSKQELVISAVAALGLEHQPTDSGVLADDVLTWTVDGDDSGKPSIATIMTSMATALGRDQSLRREFGERVLTPYSEGAVEFWRQAMARGDIGAGTDLPTMAAAVLGARIYSRIADSSPEDPSPDAVTRALVEALRTPR